METPDPGPSISPVVSMVLMFVDIVQYLARTDSVLSPQTPNVATGISAKLRKKNFFTVIWVS